MEKSELYTYKDGKSTLQFSFPMDESSYEKKMSFLNHLEMAATDLRKELGIVVAEG